MTTENTPEPKHTVQQGIAYTTVGNSITRNYVTMGGKRIYVFGSQPGDELTKSQVRRLATEPKATETPAED